VSPERREGERVPLRPAVLDGLSQVAVGRRRRIAPPAVADAFCGGRLGEARGRVYGTLPAGISEGAILDRALAV
jgi:hypothetical protein